MSSTCLCSQNQLIKLELSFKWLYKHNSIVGLEWGPLPDLTLQMGFH